MPCPNGEADGTARSWDALITKRGYAPSLGVPREFIKEFADEWPELRSIAEKLRSGRKLGEEDKLWINELAEATGWTEDAIVDELVNIDVAADPSVRVEKYKELHEKYLSDARKLKEGGDTRQAAEKLWGAITALIKLHAAARGIPILHWSMGRLDRYITNNVKREHKALFRGLLDKGHVLHEHFYEGHLDDETFEERWEEVVRLLEEARRLTI
jgi:hypothetical protein